MSRVQTLVPLAVPAAVDWRAELRPVLTSATVQEGQRGAYIEEAVALSEEGVKPPLVKKSDRKTIEVPGDLLAALKKNKKARTTIDAFSYTNKKEYVEWVAEAKREATRKRRIGAAIEWIDEGKSRNWKYRGNR